VLLNWLVVGQGALIHANHFFSVKLAERQARRFALDEPVAAVVASLTPRRLRQYTNWRLELVLTVTTISAMIWRHESVKVLAMLLYVQIGLVYVKHVIVAWRRPVPREQAAEHIAVQEAKRKYYLATIDWARTLLTVQFLVWTAPFAVWFVITIVGTVAVEIKRKQLARFALRARPVIMPALMKPARRPLYYERSAAVIGIAYLAGFIVLGHAL